MGTALLLYVDDVRTSQQAQTSTACYGDGFTCSYVDDVRTSQEAQTFTASYGGQLYFLHVDYFRTSQETRLWPPRPVTGTALR
jgi:hypothetical protein